MEVQKELEDSKMLQEKAMFKEVIRAKEGELYSTVKIEEVYKRFSLIMFFFSSLLFPLPRIKTTLLFSLLKFSLFP
jgi:hypothetical protein